MKLTFLGATHEVTGSCTFLEAAGKKILIDYGMEQGKNFFENEPVPINPSELDAVLLTHAHIDHSGQLPILVKGGFSGSVHTTRATANLADIMLRDSAHIQEFEAEWRSRKAERSGAKPYEPLYTTEDAVKILSQFVPHPYGERFELFPGISVRFSDAGHLLGSASIELWLTEDGETRKLVFSGDLGNRNQPLLNDYTPVDEADYVVIESTYGDRVHDIPPDYCAELSGILQRTFDRGGCVIIPSFAIGRTQEMLYFIRHIKETGMVKGHDGFAVYVDSPLANAATRIFVNNGADCYDEEARRCLDAGINPIAFDGLIASETSDDSKAINTAPDPKVILSASGMCEAGRIKHHLKHHLWNARDTVLFVGYQSPGTLGASLLDGAKNVRLFGESVHVGAEITRMAGVSGHADSGMMLDWLRALKRAPRAVFVNHGEAKTVELFRERIGNELGFPAEAPYSGAEYDLVGGEWIDFPRPVPIEEKQQKQNSQPQQSSKKKQSRKQRKNQKQNQQKQQTRKVSPAYTAAMQALDRLTKLLKNGEGRSNRELNDVAAMLDQISDSFEEL